MTYIADSGSMCFVPLGLWALRRSMSKNTSQYAVYDAFALQALASCHGTYWEYKEHFSPIQNDWMQ